MKHRRNITAFVATVMLLAGACGGTDDDTADPVAAPATEAPTTPPETASATSAPVTTTEPVPSGPGTDTAWIAAVEGACGEVAGQAMAIGANDGSAASMLFEIDATRAVFEADVFGSVLVPADVQPVLDHVQTMRTDALDWLQQASDLVAGGDLAAAQHALDEGFDRLARTATAWAIAGAGCALADPARIEAASLTVPLAMESWQINAGFGSVWVSQALAHSVVRLDPSTGDTLATIDVGDVPAKAQPADGRLWVRTASAYVAIDAASNSVVATLPKSDVGPAADRSWATDGALWICDGTRLHRFDPSTVELVTTVEVAIDCNSVYATDELVVAWTYNENEGESGSSIAAFVDPATNDVLATTGLPVDVGGPVVLPDEVYFPGHFGTKAVIVDRNTWGVAATPDMGAPGGGTGQAAADATSIYVVTADEMSVQQIDIATYEPTGTIEPLGVNAVATLDGALWTAKGQPFNVAQRFDL